MGIVAVFLAFAVLAVHVLAAAGDLDVVFAEDPELTSIGKDVTAFSGRYTSLSPLEDGFPRFQCNENRVLLSHLNGRWRFFRVSDGEVVFSVPTDVSDVRTLSNNPSAWTYYPSKEIVWIRNPKSHTSKPLTAYNPMISIQSTPVNECLIDNGGCSHTCTDTDDGFACSCPVGFSLGPDDLTCIALNKCSRDNGGCSHTCTDTDDGFACSCPVGFSLGPDDLTCIVDERNCNGPDQDPYNCCTPESPCEFGEGDCDSDSDCLGRLVCGTNNCNWESEDVSSPDDCCEASHHLDVDFGVNAHLLPNDLSVNSGRYTRLSDLFNGFDHFRCTDHSQPIDLFYHSTEKRWHFSYGTDADSALVKSKPTEVRDVTMLSRDANLWMHNVSVSIESDHSRAFPHGLRGLVFEEDLSDDFLENCENVYSNTTQQLLYQRVRTENNESIHVAQGDILLTERHRALLHAASLLGRITNFARVLSEGQKLWSSPIPYTINGADQLKIERAMNRISNLTTWEFVRRTREVDYIEFYTGNGCRSPVGRIGGKQGISTGPGCSVGSIIHEILHSIGLHHEQCRSDRDYFVDIHNENIKPEYAHNFDLQHGSNVGSYDYGSIMHYGLWDFTRNKKKTMTLKHPTDEKMRGVCRVGQRVGMSRSDVDAVQLRQDYRNIDGRCVEIDVGPSPEPSKTVPLLEPDMVCYSEPLHAQSTQVFDVLVTKDRLTVTRLDSEGSGWSENLKFRCCYGGVCPIVVVGSSPRDSVAVTLPARGMRCFNEPQNHQFEHQGARHDSEDVFRVNVFDNRLQVDLTNPLSDRAGWSQNLMLKCCYAGTCPTVNVGPSETQSKTVLLRSKGMKCFADARGSQNPSWNDEFRVAVSGSALTVTRTDSPEGWGQDLNIQCCDAVTQPAFTTTDPTQTTVALCGHAEFKAYEKLNNHYEKHGDWMQNGRAVFKHQFDEIYLYWHSDRYGWVLGKEVGSGDVYAYQPQDTPVGDTSNWFVQNDVNGFQQTSLSASWPGANCQLVGVGSSKKTRTKVVPLPHAGMKCFPEPQNPQKSGWLIHEVFTVSTTDTHLTVTNTKRSNWEEPLELLCCVDDCVLVPVPPRHHSPWGVNVPLPSLGYVCYPVPRNRQQPNEMPWNTHSLRVEVEGSILYVRTTGIEEWGSHLKILCCYQGITTSVRTAQARSVVGRNTLLAKSLSRLMRSVCF